MAPPVPVAVIQILDSSVSYPPRYLKSTASRSCREERTPGGMDADRRGGLRTPILADDEEACALLREARFGAVGAGAPCNCNLEPPCAVGVAYHARRFLPRRLARKLGSMRCTRQPVTALIRHSKSSCDVLHGDGASNVTAVNSWAGVSYLMPLLGAAVADSYWGKYKTVLIGLCISLVGMAMVTTSATLPSLRPPPCSPGAYCAPATLSQELVFFSGIYLCGIGIGASKAVFISFAAEQFDDEDGAGKNASGREAKASYFSWYYAVANVAMLTAGTLLVWVEDKVSWGLGYGICALFVAVAVVCLAATAPMYRIVPPAGSPMKGVLQVLVAFSRKVNLTVPDDATELYEEDGVKNPLLHPLHERLQHTEQFRCLDKAAIVTAEDLEDSGLNRPWRLCTVTQVEELKTLLRLIPIWLTSAVYFVANTQAQTTFVQQGTKTNSHIAGGAASVPAASLTSIETVLVAACVTLYNRAVAPSVAFRPLQLMGLGHATAAGAVAVAACTEARRLRMAADQEAAQMGIAWLLPQYAVMAVSDASLSVGQLQFFYDQSPETMRGASTAFYFLSVSLGNLINSQLVTLVASVTSAGGRTGWFAPELNDGHLDYYFVLVVAITLLNFAVFVALAKNYTSKRVR